MSSEAAAEYSPQRKLGGRSFKYSSRETATEVKTGPSGYLRGYMKKNELARGIYERDYSIVLACAIFC